MTINYTTLLGLAKPVTGTETGQWGDVVNDEITSLLEDAVANAATFSVTVGDVTLSTTNGASNQARMSTLIITGSPGILRNVIVPSQAKIYVVINQANAEVVIKGAATTGVTVGAGQTAQIAWNGSDFVEIGNYVHGNFVVNGNLSVNGNSTLGDGGADTTTINGQFIGANSNISKATTVSTSAPALAWVKGATYTDTASAGGTTQAHAPFTLLSSPTLATSNIVTYTNASTFYIAGAPSASGSATITNPYAMYVAAGEAYLAGAVTMAATTQNLALGTSQTSGTWTAGGAAQTGALTLDQSTKTHTLNLGTGATESAATKTVNIGTAGVSGSTTAVNIGSAVSGATNNVTINGNPTFNSGTANGVLYLDGSKVATSGSALTFDGATLGVTRASAGTSASFAAGGQTLKIYGDSTSVSVGAGGALAYGTTATFYDPTNLAQIYTVNGSEQMRLTSTGLGIGTSSPTQKLDVVGNIRGSGNLFAGFGNANASVQVLSSVSAGGSGNSELYFGNATNPTQGYLSYSHLTNALLFGTSTTTQMTLDSSGNLGIGTSSPTNRLTVAAPNAKQNVVSTTGTNEVVLFLQNTGGDFYIGRENSAGTYFSAPAYSANLYSGGAYPMLFWINSTERMRLDSSGNLGLGVTPSAWVSTSRALQILPYASVSCQTNGAANFGFNFYESSGNTFSYTTTDQAGRFSALTDGSFAWFTAPSGTAGNTISFTQAMTLDASGNLGLGVTPSAWGSILKPIQLGNAFSYVAGRTDGVRQVWLGSNSYYNGTNWIYGLSSPAAQYYQNDGIHIWNTAPSGTAGNAISFSQVMTLDASGRLGIGLTNPAYRLDVEISGGPYNARFANSSTSTSEYNVTLWGQNASGSAIGYIGTGGSAVGNAAFQNTFVVGTQTSNALVFATTDTERARITSGGNFKIGGTADRATTEGDKQLVLFNGTAPVGTLANGISIYSSSGEAYVMDAAGNATLFSPHDAKTNEWIFKSKHTPTGKVLKIDVERLLRFINDHFGLDAVQEFIEP